MEEICGMSGYSPVVVAQSLDRLCASLLVEQRGDLFRACSIEEFLITSRLNHDPCSDIYIENGVVKVRNDSRRESLHSGSEDSMTEDV